MDQQGTQTRLLGLPPVVDATTRVIILGTFPGARSLDVKQYYADSRNHFWSVMSRLHHDDYLAVPYSIRIKRLLLHKIGLWDVFGSCVRRGSLDKSIIDPHINDIASLRLMAPDLEVLCLNGGKAAVAAGNFTSYGYRLVTLPSSSSAHAVSIDKKAKAWQDVIPNYFPPISLPEPIKALTPVSAAEIRRAIKAGRRK